MFIVILAFAFGEQVWSMYPECSNQKVHYLKNATHWIVCHIMASTQSNSCPYVLFKIGKTVLNYTPPQTLFVFLFDLILYVHSTIFQLCGTVLPGLNQY